MIYGDYLLNHNKSRWGMFMVFAFVAVALSLMQPPIFFPDSGSYLVATSSRTLAYPMILKFVNLIFGPYGLRALTIFQLFSVLCVSRMLVNCIADVLSLNGYAKLILFFVSLYPWLLVGDLRLAMVILTEPLTYVAIVLVIVGLVSLSEHYSHKQLGVSAIWFLLSMMLRPQMIFIWGGFMTLALYYLWAHKAYRYAVNVMVVASLMVVLSFGVNAVYKVTMFGKNEHTFAYSQALVPALYVSDQGVINHVQSKDLRNLLTSIHHFMKEKCLLKSSRETSECGALGVEHYLQTYNRIYGGMGSVVRAYAKEHEFKSVSQTYRQLVQSLLVVELQYEPFTLAKQYFHSIVVFGLHGRYVASAFFMLFIAAVAMLRYQNDQVARMLMAFLILHLCNLVFVSFFEVNIFRYMFYTEVPIMVMMFALLSKSLINVSQR